MKKKVKYLSIADPICDTNTAPEMLFHTYESSEEYFRVCDLTKFYKKTTGKGVQTFSDLIQENFFDTHEVD